MPVVSIDCRRITNSDTFHDVFAEAFGFPNFYGRNMGAWIDCLSYLNEPGAGMTSIRLAPGGVAVLRLDHVEDFATRCPKLYADIIECSLFLNLREIEAGRPVLLALAFSKSG